jgi:GxxExxY protein
MDAMCGLVVSDHSVMTQNFANDPLTERVIGCAIEVHRHLGPGLLESTYGECLSWEFLSAGLEFKRQLEVPVIYKGKTLAAIYRVDFVIEQQLVVEIKAVERPAPVHEAQLLTYLKHTGIPVGLLVNFNTPVLKDGLRRLVLRRPEILEADNRDSENGTGSSENGARRQ